jgi:hypothetical protein
VMLAARVSRLEARDAVAKVDAMHQAEVGQLLEHAVHARKANGPAVGTQSVEELLRRDAAVLRGEVGDHRVTRAPGACS